MAKETREAETRKGLALFHEARGAEARSDYLQAMDLYNKLIHSSLPDPEGNKSRAKAAVADIKIRIKNGITQILEKSEQLKSQEKYREACEQLDRAMKWDPSDSRVLQALEAVQSELKRKMKTLYNDGVLEENIGNLETAKQKWRTIRDQDLKSGDYYRKAVRKLKRYGE
jgi:tetratricopeptide (TPR) repeat protein